MALVTAVLALAAFNLTFRVGNESLTEWDGSLYAHSAYEMVESGRWVATTFYGALDYYNSKPPLNVWLIALSLKAFDASLVSVRLASIVSAWLTVLVLLVWAWRRSSPTIALFSSLVLSTCFGFLHVHSGRTANPDAPLTLLLLLIMVVLDVSRERPWRRVWLGPLLAGVFLLKGMAVAMPLLLIAAVEAGRRMSGRERWRPLVAAALLAAVPVGAWGIARWQVDQWTFFHYLFFQDFIALSTTSLDDHRGTPFFYLNILQKHHYEWLIAAITVGVLCPPTSWTAFARRLAFWRSDHDLIRMLGWWVAIALLVPTLLQTKLPWYINPLYPVFALGVGAALSHGFARQGLPSLRRKLLVAMVILVAVVAEAKLVWYSYRYRSLDRSVQGLLLAETGRLHGTRVYRSSWNHADTFVMRAMVGAEQGEKTIQEFLAHSDPGEYLVAPADTGHPHLVRIAVRGDFALYLRQSRNPPH